MRTAHRIESSTSTNTGRTHGQTWRRPVISSKSPLNTLNPHVRKTSNSRLHGTSRSFESVHPESFRPFSLFLSLLWWCPDKFKWLQLKLPPFFVWWSLVNFNAESGRLADRRNKKTRPETAGLPIHDNVEDMSRRPSRIMMIYLFRSAVVLGSTATALRGGGGGRRDRGVRQDPTRL